MPTFPTTLLILSSLAVAALLAAAIASALRRWRLAAGLSGGAALAALLIGILALVMFRIRLAAAVDPALKARLLSQGVAEMATSIAPALLVAPLAVILWAVVRARSRQPTPPPG